MLLYLPYAYLFTLLVKQDNPAISASSDAKLLSSSFSSDTELLLAPIDEWGGRGGGGGVSLLHSYFTHFPLLAENPDGHVACLDAEHWVEVPPFLPLQLHFQLLLSSDISS